MLDQPQADVTGEGRASLRSAALLVAEGASDDHILAVLNEQVARTLSATATSIVRLEPDDRMSVAAAWSARDPPRHIGERSRVRAEIRALCDAGTCRRLDGPMPAGPDGLRRAVGMPLTVEGAVWGVAFAGWDRLESVPPGAERQLAELGGLIAAALATTRLRRELRGLADEHAALREVAELVARGVAPDELFATVATAAARLVGDQATTLLRFADGGATVVATCGGPAPVGAHFAISAGDQSTPARVLRTRRPARQDPDDPATAPSSARKYAVGSSVGAPIVVADELWGMLGATSDGSLPMEAELRLQQFAELVGAALANAQARADLERVAEERRRLADEQAALRRVAELVARGAASEDLFAAVAAEAGGLLSAPMTLTRFEDDRNLVVVATSGGPAPVGARIAFDEKTLPDHVRQRGAAYRVDDYRVERDAALAARFGLSAAVAAPITVEGAIWGMLTATSESAPLPAGTEHRLHQFADLVAAALANTHARAELQRLVDEQAGLRRVAELVARGVAPADVFAAVAIEAATLLGYERTWLIRLHDDGARRVVAHHGGHDADDPGDGASVRVPITVGGTRWGELAAAGSDPPLPDMELRLAQFADLAAAAIANADSRAQLTASRARVLATADEARRRLQRDVHDGAQQRLVQTLVTLKLAKQALDDGSATAPELIEESLAHAERANIELRQLVHGILPASLTRGGLRVGVESLLVGLALPVAVDADVPRLPPAIETTAYFVVAEALTNVVKHAHARSAQVRIGVDGESLAILVRDDGAGGADPRRGSGLTGLRDRVEAGDGTLEISSPPGDGTTVRARLPLRGAPAG